MYKINTQFKEFKTNQPIILSEGVENYSEELGAYFSKVLALYPCTVLTKYQSNSNMKNVLVYGRILPAKFNKFKFSDSFTPCPSFFFFFFFIFV